MDKTPYTPVVPTSPSEINFLEHGLQNCPYHAYRLLQDEEPIWIDPVTGFYVITRFDDLRGLLLDPANFSNDMRKGGASRERSDSARATRMLELYQEKGWVPGPTLAGRDDPNHKQMRAMFNEAFNPKKINGLDLV